MNAETRNTLVICPGSDRDLGLFSDLYDREDVGVVYPELRFKWFSLIRKAIFTINKIDGVCLKQPDFLYSLELGSIEGVSRVIVRSNVLEYIPVSLFRKLKKKGIRVDLLLIDSMDAGSYTILKTRKEIMNGLWDKVITFDPEDAARYGFSFEEFHYYSQPKVNSQCSCTNDIYYAGSFKGNRKDFTVNCFNKMTSDGLFCVFDIYSPGKTSDMPGGINFRNIYIPYSTVLENVCRSRCILEIVQENQSGPSLRYFEAVALNKKLISTNPHIVDFPYYNPDYMKVIADPKDIDSDWIKENIPVDYHYRGDFSPLRLINQTAEL